MQPVHDTTTTQPTAIDSREFTRALGAAFAAIALAGIVLAALAFLTSRPATSVDTSAAAAGEVRDGWSSYLGGAARPAAQPVRDGWSSYLLAPEIDPNTIVDGWSSYLLVPEIDPNTIVDGWSSYLLAPEIDPNTIVDGWMSRYGHDD
jgi:hypothetical protein